MLIALGVYLIIRMIKKIPDVITGGTSAPDNIKKAFNLAFDTSPYASLKDNWLAVSKMETAAWESNLFVNNLNLWGMKVPKKRPTTVVSSGWGTTGRDNLGAFPNATEIISRGIEAFQNQTGQQTWAKYANINDAARDIILWMEYTKFPKGPLSLRDHISAMKDRAYFQEPLSDYLNLVIAWQNK